VSRDRGLTWTPPQQINLPGTRIVNEPLWQVSVGEPGHLVVDYAGTQGAGPDLNAYLVETTNALADHPVFRGAALNDPNGDWHEPYALGSEDYTDVEIGPDGIARAAFPRGKVGYLAPSRR
jgi:hypothetical protein